MRRVVVVGAGLFGLVIASRLAQRGITPLVAARSRSSRRAVATTSSSTPRTTPRSARRCAPAM